MRLKISSDGPLVRILRYHRTGGWLALLLLVSGPSLAQAVTYDGYQEGRVSWMKPSNGLARRAVAVSGMWGVARHSERGVSLFLEGAIVTSLSRGEMRGQAASSSSSWSETAASLMLGMPFRKVLGGQFSVKLGGGYVDYQQSLQGVRSANRGFRGAYALEWAGFDGWMRDWTLEFSGYSQGTTLLSIGRLFE